ncbi:DNA-(apurinic or apyrimidinic site) lyase 2 [Phytophthora boehmeriae]|uniref:DNA-(apurinic or apyrimidinic site) endonuclease 2 n=1 Tax=Phytophthora boehmeriae TaxID=109152 RepID=A0A8T1WSI2_9STRA|nr:DNA-(apurinic or apyrimidinic site) lyase 2 [Phytophthora boehmeriae]
MKMRLMTWNVNGLRAVLQRLDQSLKQFLDGLDADIVCLQETKLTRSELDQELVRPPGYDAFYSFCRQRGGYSGVVTFCKSEMPTVAAEEGLTGLWRTEDSVGHVGSIHRELNSKLVNNLESEGRCVITDHQAFVLINTYCPALASQDRLEYKLQFHALLEDRVRALQEANKRVIVVGDINIAHREIDHCDPGAYRIEGVSFSDHPCRRWMDSFVGTPDEKGGASSPQSQAVKESENNISNQPILIDTFRYFHPAQTKAFTPTVLRSVVKVNENWGRKFYVCTKPTGEKGNPDARCDFFQWADKNRKKATNNTQ